MKRILVACAVALITGLSLTATAQQKVCPGQCPTIEMAGEFNGKTPGGGNSTDTARKIWYTSKGEMPLYTKTVTLTNTANDSMWCKLIGEYNSVYTWVHVDATSGTLTNTTVTLYISYDAGYGTDWQAVYTTSLTATSSQAPGYLINSGNGWPATNLKWIIDGGGTQVSQIYGGIEVKYFEPMDAFVDQRRRWRTGDEDALQTYHRRH